MWTQHDKTDWGERIYQSIVYFDDRLWMYGGMDYEARTFSNDIWSSTDGATWTPAGTAAWPGAAATRWWCSTISSGCSAVPITPGPTGAWTAS